MAITFYKLAPWIQFEGQDDWKHTSTYGFKDATEADAVWFEHDAFLSGDYCGNGALGRSNVRTWREMFPEAEDVLYHVCHGSYGSEWIRFNIACLSHHDMKEALDGLDDHPLLSADDHSELEMSDEDEAWENHGRSDFVRALRACNPNHEDLWDHVPDEALWMIWREMVGTWNIQGGSGCVHEQGGVYFDFDDIQTPYRHLPPRTWHEIRRVIMNGIVEYRNLPR